MAAQKFGSYFDYLLIVDSLTKNGTVFGSLFTIGPSLSGASMSSPEISALPFTPSIRTPCVCETDVNSRQGLHSKLTGTSLHD